jgi:hypothetical protein
MGGFKTLAEIGAEMDRLASTYPSIVSPKFSIGTSIEGRPIWAMRVSDSPTIEEAGEPRVFLDAIHHAREPMGGEAALLFALTSWPRAARRSRGPPREGGDLRPACQPDGYRYSRTVPAAADGRESRRNNGSGSFAST